MLSDVASTYVGMGHRGPRGLLGVVPRAVGGAFRQGDDEVGSSGETRALSQEETRPEEAATPEEERASQSSHLDRSRTLEAPEEITLKGVDLFIVLRPEGAKGRVRLPIRWTVERTFAWLGRCRRLSKDREKSVLSSESFIKLALIQLMLHRLRPDETDAEFHYRITG